MVIDWFLVYHKILFNSLLVGILQLIIVYQT